MSWVKGNFYLNRAQMENNAFEVKNWLTENDPGWSNNALYALLGNMQQESGINPGIWQSLKPGSAGGGGWGLVQWTPWTNFTNWASANGYPNDSGEAQMLWIRDRTIPTGQWIQTKAYPISFLDFKKSTRDVDWLAMAFCKNFERGTVGDRVQYAIEWAQYFGDDPEPPDPGPEPDPDPPWDFRQKMPIWFYNLPWN